MADPVHNVKRLKELRALPLERKIQISQARIIEWYNYYHGQVVVSFSGGKDSTVLLHLVRSIYPDVKAVFSNTGLEYPEIQKHVKSIDNVDIVKPSMRFDEVISTYGYPLISKEVAESIYYARRIRSQPVNVEREREREPDSKAEASRTARLQNGYKTGGAEPTESDRESASLPTEESSHRDKHCEEQTNRPDGADARTGDGTGVVDGKLAASNGEGTSETDFNFMGRYPQTSKSIGSEGNILEGNGTQRKISEEQMQSRGSTDWHDWRRGCL